jgi:hypothetical protein
VIEADDWDILVVGTNAITSNSDDIDDCEEAII